MAAAISWDAPDLDDTSFRVMIVNEVTDDAQDVSKELKLEAVKLVTARGMSATQPVRDVLAACNYCTIPGRGEHLGGLMKRQTMVCSTDSVGQCPSK